MRNLEPRRLLLALLVAFSLVVAACGDDDDGGAAGGRIAEEIDLDGISITVGSKDFTEQLVLGELMVQSFEAAGADVTNKVDLGGTVVNREALLSGEIDVYMEYNGTAWTVHLGQEDPSFDPQQLTEDVRALDLAENSIRWVGKSPFNDTYGFATGSELTEANGGAFTMQSMADYLAANPDATVCMESEFPSRPDGLILFEEATGYEVPDSQVEILDTNIIYNETANGNCDFGEIFTTDGRIPALEMAIVEDPGVMIVYNVSLTMRDETYQQAPEAFEDLAVLLFDGLDEDAMAELNRLVSVEGEDAADVARDYLVSKGLISG
jgi:osmoprotectant transport system substrate-binding protein